MNRFEAAARDYCTKWIERPQFKFVIGMPVPTGATLRQRPRIHPLVPHPGSGPGAVRMITRLLEKEAVLAQQATRHSQLTTHR